MNKSVCWLFRALRCSLPLLLLAGCAASSPRVAYYSLVDSRSRPVTAQVQDRDQLTLTVGPVTVPDVLKPAQIATGGAEGRFVRSEFHRWAGEVDDDIGRALAEQLSRALGSERVYLVPADQHLQPDCQVLVDIVTMDGDLGQQARMVVRWTLVDPKGQWQPVSRRSELSERPLAAGYEAWVVAQQRNLDGLGAEMAALIRKQTGRLSP